MDSNTLGFDTMESTSICAMLTISSLRRKVARAAYRDADACARRYPDKDASTLRTFFNYERLIKQFGRVEDFDGQDSDYRSWTFWTYASRASKIFGRLGKTILRQLRKTPRLDPVARR